MTTPTSDLVERLLKAADLPDTSRVDPLLAKVVHHLADLMSEAAARLTELEAEVSRLREREKVMTEALTEIARQDYGLQGIHEARNFDEEDYAPEEVIRRLKAWRDEEVRYLVECASWRRRRAAALVP